MPLGNDQHRLKEDQNTLISWTDAARERYGYLTDAQAKKVGAVMFATFPTSSPAFQDAYFNSIQKQQPDLFRKSPSVHQSHAWLIEGKNYSEQMKIAKFREIAALDADARLLLVPASAKLVADPVVKKPSVAVDTRSPYEISRESGWSKEDQILEERGLDPKSMLPDRRMEYRYEIAKETVAPDLRNVAEVKAKIAAGTPWSKLPPSNQISAFREAQSAGMTLAELGVDVSSAE